jgi:hypothetical protein
LYIYDDDYGTDGVDDDRGADDDDKEADNDHVNNGDQSGRLS